MRALANFALAVAVAGCSHSTQPKPVSNSVSEPPADAAALRRWTVYDGTNAILEVTDEPGPLISTASPSGGTPVTHPFLSATALDGAYEDQLRQLLLAAKSTDEFITALRRAGFRVEDR